MARMKFLCDADRCIECNACVTACKNENEVPWGINRRRVVTINDGKPGERSVSMACMHCTDAPCAAVCPVNCFYTTADGVVLHSKDLCIGCGYCFYACPFGAPQYPQVGNFGSRGKMDKCTYLRRRARRPTAASEEYEKYGANRLAEGKLPLCAEMCSTKSLLAGDGEIIAQIYKERVTKRGYGSGAWGWKTAYRETIAVVSREATLACRRATDRAIEEETAWRSFCAQYPLRRSARWRSSLLVAMAAPVRAQRSPTLGQSDRQRRSRSSSCCRSSTRIQGRGTIPGHEILQSRAAGGPRLAPVPRGDAALDRRHRDPRHARAAGRLLSDPRHGADRERPLRAHHRALQRLRALRALDDGDLLHHPGAVRTQHHLRQALLLPLIGPEAFAAWSQWAKYAHNI